MDALKIFNLLVAAAFFLCYAYQFYYIPVAWFRKRKPHGPETLHRFAVLIAARNESAVIGNLLDSLRAQNYPAELLDLYVVADNCTDDTAAIAASRGARVWQRFNTHRVGKGYALEFLLDRVCLTAEQEYDGFLVFDADNLVDPDFVRQINRTYCDGYSVVTCYRNTKNYGDNWISAGYGLWFLREARYLNDPRMKRGTSCAVSGTGFFFSRQVLEQCGGWKFFCLTEDIEFSIRNVTNGVRIGYCPEAVIYDEQPTEFVQSWNQRLRWSKGYLQVLQRYGGELASGMLRGSFSCYDMMMNILPAQILTLLSCGVNLTAAVIGLWNGIPAETFLLPFLQTLAGMYGTLFFLGFVTTVTEWKKIRCSALRKIGYAFTFPLFMMTYFPIYVVSLFKPVKWVPIRHRRSLTLEQVCAVKEK
ncbi:MAG: glycosyltransferase family 2 protein [Firmicutes bacterium]|nr:glycosyltransferase family 2 protein [Bacillota bacterium]